MCIDTLLVLFIICLFAKVCWGRDRSCWRNKAFPFIVEINECGDILFPRLYVMWIHRYGFLLVSIFVCQSSEAMTELMYNDLLVKWMVRHAKVVRIQYATAAVFRSVYQHNDVFVWSSGKCIV